jgi:predicted dehydrogenase
MAATTGLTRVGVIGCGFWAQSQVSGWCELPDVRIVAVCDRDRDKAVALAGQFDITGVYDDAGAMLAREGLDVADVITSPDTHAAVVGLAAARGVPVICQKPLAASLAEAERTVATCARAGVPLWVHENWRWQAPMRALKAVLDDGRIGRVFRARLDFVNGFPVFQNQPFLRELKKFILTDVGTHVLDAARFLFGEAETVYCRTDKVHRDIAGEDVATVVLGMAGGGTVTCNLAYAENHLEHDRFPETFVFVEGERGSAEIGPDYWVRVTTADGTTARRHPPARYAWADPAYDVVQASIVPCCADLLAAVRGERPGETTGEDNLRTLRLVFGAYESAARGAVVQVGGEA